MAKMTFQQMIEESGHETRSYSGRGMYGRECLGVEVSRLSSLMADLFDAVANADEDEMSDLAAQASEAFGSMRTDSMGHDIIVYFEQVPYVDLYGDDEDETDPEETRDNA